MLVFSLLITANASVWPQSLEATLAPGEFITETKTVTIPEISPKVDVIFAFDVSGSMYNIIGAAKAGSITIMDELGLTGTDVDFGVVSYMDYPNYYNSYSYFAPYGYGWCGDYAYSLDQPITNDTGTVAAAINGLMMGCGADPPQDYARVFYESYSDPSITWRPGSRRILINFGDSIPHDDDLNQGFASGVWSKGGDPGRDEIMFTEDDLDLQTVLADMAANNITLIEIHATDQYSEYWNYWTNITGGANYITSSETVVGNVITAITNAFNTTDNLHWEVSPGFESWLESVTPASYSGPSNTTTNFDLVITVPELTPDGTYTFNISAIDNYGVNYGDQTVTINVVSEVLCEDDRNCNAGKVLLCHIPDGNPENAHSICVSENAVNTHLEQHGDYLGPCVIQCE